MSEKKNLQEFINNKVAKLQKKHLLEQELKEVEEELEKINEAEDKDGETPSYQKITDSDFEKNLSSVVASLGNAGKEIEGMLSKLKIHGEHGMVQDANMVTRHGTVKEMLMDIYKKIRATEVKARDASNLKY